MIRYEKRLGAVLMLAGSGALLWSATVWSSAALFEKYEAWRWKMAHAEALRTPAVRQKPAAPPAVEKPRPHEVIAWLEVPRLHVSTAVLEGDDAMALRFGAGHIPDTPLPGAIGNVGIAAHRDTFFQSLAGIEPQDRIRVETPSGDWEYTVESTQVVQPSDIGVLANSHLPELTLVTCYPFRYVGPAPLRFIVRARRIS